MNIHDLYLLLLEKKELTIRTVDKASHDNLRVRLCRVHSAHKTTMADLDYSDSATSMAVSGSFDRDTGTSNFALREKKQKKEYEIVSPEHE